MAYLSLSNITKSIDGALLLDNVTMEVEKGTITLVAGPNGSGKSTLLKCIKGLEKPDRGKIILDGAELGKEKQRMKLFGLVFQDTSLQIVGRTVEKDIAFGLENEKKSIEEIRRKTEEMLALFSLEKERKKDPRILSGGERRRLSIAGVLAMDSKVILLDEPLANLDYPSIMEVLKTLVRLKEEGVTIIIVSHEVEKLLALTDNTVILNNGRVVASGKSPDMLSPLRENNIYLPPLDFEELTWLRK